MMSNDAHKLVDALVDELVLSVTEKYAVEKLVGAFEVELIDDTRRLLADAAHKAVMEEYVEGQ